MWAWPVWLACLVIGWLTGVFYYGDSSSLYIVGISFYYLRLSPKWPTMAIVDYCSKSLLHPFSVSVSISVFQIPS